MSGTYGYCASSYKELAGVGSAGAYKCKDLVLKDEVCQNKMFSLGTGSRFGRCLCDKTLNCAVNTYGSGTEFQRYKIE